MKILSAQRLAITVILAAAFFSCNKKEDFQTASLSDYMPVVAGKYITYRLDSMVFTNFGRSVEVHKYQVKHQVDALITDNLGRPAYRVFRYIRDTAGIQPWVANGSYFITLLSDQAELSEDNLRFIKLHLPFRNGFTWKGNKFLPTDPYGPLFNFSNDDNMEDWDYIYDGEPSSFSYRGNNYSDVYTVEEANEAFNIPVTSAGSYGTKSRAVEKYARGVGLVYREYLLWEYQPNTGGSGGPYNTGFGITMWMIDHN
jgi:hypothetical protein